MNAQQADLITDIESYKKVTGAKRFKRTKDEMDRGLSVEKALQERLDAAKNGTKKAPRASTSKKGDFVIKIRPLTGVDSDYFEKVPREITDVILDEKWYSWFDTLLEKPYNGDVRKLLKHIFDLGIGEVLTTMHFEDDIKNYEASN